jgi:hypothetical protein
VSPSGKAVASQVTIRGFESHHPLKKEPQLKCCGSLIILTYHQSGMTIAIHLLPVEDLQSTNLTKMKWAGRSPINV